MGRESAWRNLGWGRRSQLDWLVMLDPQRIIQITHVHQLSVYITNPDAEHCNSIGHGDARLFRPGTKLISEWRSGQCAESLTS